MALTVITVPISVWADRSEYSGRCWNSDAHRWLVTQFNSQRLCLGLQLMGG